MPTRTALMLGWLILLGASCALFVLAAAEVADVQARALAEETATAAAEADEWEDAGDERTARSR